MGSGMGFRTQRARVWGLGTAHGGTHDWWQKRVSSVAMIPLTPLFVVPFARALGESHAHVVALYANPFHALIAMLFLGVGFWHLSQALHEVIIDYMHHKGWRVGLLIAKTMFCTVFGLAGIFAVLKIAVAG